MYIKSILVLVVLGTVSLSNAEDVAENHEEISDIFNKDLAYDEIDEMLTNELPDNDDVDANMAKAEELLSSVPQDGELAGALKQFLQLKLTLNEDTCNEKGHEILYKNSLSTRLTGYSHRVSHKKLRRVGRIYVHYSEKHVEICRPVVVEKLKSMVKELNPDTYRKILGLASARFLEAAKFDTLVEELNEKEIDGNFYTPLLAGRAERYIESLKKEKATFCLENIDIGQSDNFALLEYLKAISEGDPNSDCLQLDEEAGQQSFDEGKVKQIINKYLLEPCEDYLQSMGGFVDADLFGLLANPKHKKSPKDKAMSELTYHFVEYGYLTCESLLRTDSFIFEAIKDAIVPNDPSEQDA